VRRHLDWQAIPARSLSPAERARKKPYEKLHPETKQGKAPGAGRGKKKSSEESQVETFVSRI
jgi:hypothetical protein